MSELPGQSGHALPPSNRRSCAKDRKSRRFDMDKAPEASLVTLRPPSGPDEPHGRQHGYAFLSLRRQALHQPLAAPKLIGHFRLLFCPFNKMLDSSTSETNRFPTTRPFERTNAGTRPLSSTLTNVERWHMEARHEHEKSRWLVRTLRPRYGTGEGLLRKSSRRLTDAIKAVGWQPRKHVGLPDEPRREWRLRRHRQDGRRARRRRRHDHLLCLRRLRTGSKARQAGRRPYHERQVLDRGLRQHSASFRSRRQRRRIPFHGLTGRCLSSSKSGGLNCVRSVATSPLLRRRGQTAKM